MPYKIYPSGDKFKVCKKNEDGSAGECFGEHDSRKAASGQMRALYASESGEKMNQLDQRMTAYTPLSATDGQACANCMFFRGSDHWNPCMLVEDYPLGIEPTGWCNEWRAIPVHVQEPMPVTIVDGAGSRSQTEPLPYGDIPEGAVRRGLKALVDLVLRRGEKGSEEPQFGFRVLPDGRWLGIWSNNFKDKANEFFPYAVQDAFISRVKSGISPFPTLRYWHIKADFGRADDLGRVGNFSWAVGNFYQDDASQAMKAYLQANGPWAMSHGFQFFKSLVQDGSYLYFDTFEVSVLPPHAACNPYTLFDGGIDMKATQEQIDILAKALGDPSLAQKLVDQTDAAGASLEGAGVQQRSMEEPVILGGKGQQLLENLGTALVTLATGMNALTEGQKADADARKGLESRIESIETFVKGVMAATPPASKDSRTLIPPNNPALSILQQNMDPKQGGKSIIEQALATGQFNMSDVYSARASNSEGVPPTVNP